MYCGHVELHKSSRYGRSKLQKGKCGEQVVHTAQLWVWALTSHWACTPLALDSKRYVHGDLYRRTTVNICADLLRYGKGTAQCAGHVQLPGSWAARLTTRANLVHGTAHLGTERRAFEAVVPDAASRK